MKMQKQLWQKLLGRKWLRERRGTTVPAPQEILGEAMRRDGGDMKPSGEETPSKKNRKFPLQGEKTLDKAKAFPSTSLPAGQPNPITPILFSLRSSSAPSRSREAFELLIVA